MTGRVSKDHREVTGEVSLREFRENVTPELSRQVGGQDDGGRFVRGGSLIIVKCPKTYTKKPMTFQEG